MENENISVSQYLKNAFRQGLQVFKTPKKLLPTIVIGIIWLVIGILSSTMRPFPWPLKIVSFLSYAEGGLFGGVLGAVGGIVGKVVVAVFINALVLPLFEKKPPFSGVAGGFKGMLASVSKNSAKGVAPLLNGIGVALLLYMFMNISQSWQNAMVGIVAVVLILQNIGNKGGFLFGLLSAIVNSRSKGKALDFVSMMRFLSGMTIGFTLGVGLTLVGLRWCFWLGLLFLIVGVILGKVVKTKK